MHARTNQEHKARTISHPEAVKFDGLAKLRQRRSIS